MKAKRSLFQILFEAKSIDSVAPVPKTLTYIILGFWTFVCLFPLYWLIVTSFKIPIQVHDGPLYFPGIDFKPSMHAWEYIFVVLGNDTLRPYLNTLLISSTSSILAVGIGSMAGYALTRITFSPKLGSVLMFIGTLVLTIVAVVWLKLAWQIALASGLALYTVLLVTVGRKFKKSLNNNDIAFFMISQRILPPVAVVIPIYVLFQRIGLLDTHAALIITYTAVNLPIVVWLMRDFFESIPLDLEESASLDGASRYRVFFTIILPLSKPGLAATFLLVLILCWNEYLIALFLSTAKAQTLPLLIAAMNATRGPQWWYMSVVIIIMITPIVAITVVLQRFITRGLLIGAVKG
jgi:multiple sugar transport system permease protein